MRSRRGSAPSCSRRSRRRGGWPSRSISSSSSSAKYVLFAPFAFNLWGRFGWAAMAQISTTGIILLALIANLWFRWFASGPLEWLWRSLAYVKWQPLLRPPLSAPPPPDPAAPSAPAAAAAAAPAAR
ncbi:MAG: DUF418 domain-containing protein [Sphingomonas sp.]